MPKAETATKAKTKKVEDNMLLREMLEEPEENRDC